MLVSAGGRSLLVARAGRMRVLLEARHAVVDVAGVRVHGRHADRREVVGEVVLGVVLGILGASLRVVPWPPMRKLPLASSYIKHGYAL